MLTFALKTVFYLMVFKKVASIAIDYKCHPAIKLFQEYIQINTTTNSDLSPAVEYWRKLAKQENVALSVHEFVKGYPVVVIKWPSKDPSLSSVMLNSHMDVVPANEQDGWKFPPFSGHIDDNGDIYGRGTQDMKCLAIQQFEALRRLKNKNSLLRTVYMTLMPDEETGSDKGMIQFVKSKQFASMKVGIGMDEGWGQPVPNTVTVFTQDKAVWQFRVDCYGSATHASLLPPPDTTAAEKCFQVANHLFKFRTEQYKIAKKSLFLKAGDFTSVNLVMMNGGTAVNIIPGHVSFTFDVRLGTSVDEDVLLAKLTKIISDAGDNVTLTFLQKSSQTPATVTNDSNPYWKVLKNVARANNITLNPIVCTGTSDARYLRDNGIPAFGLSPMMNTPLRPHKVNEYLNAAEFLRGLSFYEQIVESIANMPDTKVSNDSSVYIVKNKP